MEKEKLKDYLIKGTTFREIAKLEKISHQIVDYYVKKYDLREFVINQKPITYNLNKIDSAEKAYMLGFIAGDATFSESGILDISIKYEDREVLEFIAEILECDIQDNLKTDKTKRIFPNSRVRCKIPDILTFITERLKKGRNLPITSKKLEPYLLQGFFDAEGCITWGYRADRNRLWQKVSFTSSLSLLTSLQTILLSYGISTSIKPKTGEDCFVIEFSNELDVFTFLKILPKDTYYLKRKRKNYLEWLNDIIAKYSFNVGDNVKFLDKRTLNKYKVSFGTLFNGNFTVVSVENEFCVLNNGLKVNKLLLSKESIKNYALRLELDEFGETILRDTIPSLALDHSNEGVETTGGKLGSLNNQLEHPSLN